MADADESAKSGFIEQNIELGTKIGGGQFGSVYKAKWQGNDIVVKRVKIDASVSQFVRAFVVRLINVCIVCAGRCRHSDGSRIHEACQQASKYRCCSSVFVQVSTCPVQ